MENPASAQSIPKNSDVEDKEHEEALERAGKVWDEVSARKINEQKAALEKLRAQKLQQSGTKGGRRKRKRTHKKNKKPNKLHKKTRRH